MKKRLTILFAVFLSITLIGCSNETEKVNSEYENAISNGKSKVIEDDYNKAINYFELALESKKDDLEATNLIKQLNLLIESKEFEDKKDYFEQIKILDEIQAIDTATNVIKSKADEYKQTVIKSIDDSILEIEKDIENKEYEKSQKALENIIKECEKSDNLKAQLDKCIEALETCKEKKKQAEELAKKEKNKSINLNDDNSDQGSDYYHSGQGYCVAGAHYTDVSNLTTEGMCYGCFLKKDFQSPSTYGKCPYCGKNGVSQFLGKCYFCYEKVHSSIKNILEDGTVIYEDGTSKNFFN